MKNIKSLLALMAAVLLLMSYLASCSSTGEEKEDGNDSTTETIISAITTDGTFYCVHCDLYNTYERSETMVFSTQSCNNLRSTLYRYCADGTVYRTVRADEAIQWKLIEPDA